MSFIGLLTKPSSNLPPFWFERQSQSQARVKSEGLPTRKDEEWKYTSLRKLNDLRIEDLSGEAAAAYILAESVSLELNDSGLKSHEGAISVQPWSDGATQRYATIIEEHDSAASFLNDMNSSLVTSAHIIKITDQRASVTLLDRTTGASGLSSHFMFFHIAAGASLDLRIEHIAAGAAYKNLRLFFLLESESTVYFDRFHTASDASLTFLKTNVQIESRARLQLFDFTRGSDLLRNELFVKIRGEEAEANLAGIYLGQNEQHIDNHITVIHECPNARSSQVYRGVLNDRARAVFSGKVRVRQVAQGTNASQLTKTLMLSSEAEMDAKPQLEIDADDVKCGHGAATTRINPDELFYLRSRGYTPEAARKTLIQAFVNESLYACHSESGRERLKAYLAAQEVL